MPLVSLYSSMRMPEIKKPLITKKRDTPMSWNIKVSFGTDPEKKSYIAMWPNMTKPTDTVLRPSKDGIFFCSKVFCKERNVLL